MTIKELDKGKKVLYSMFTCGEISLSTYLNMDRLLDEKKHKLYLAHTYSAPRELSLEEAKQIDSRYNEKLGKIKMDKEGNITVENPYPNHHVIFCGTMTSGTHIKIDGKEIPKGEDVRDYWFGIK